MLLLLQGQHEANLLHDLNEAAAVNAGDSRRQRFGQNAFLVNAQKRRQGARHACSSSWHERPCEQK